MSHLWKKFQVHQRKFTKRAPTFFLASCGKYQDIIHLLTNPKFPRTSMYFNNHNLCHKTLKDQALSGIIGILGCLVASSASSAQDCEVSASV